MKTIFCLNFGITRIDVYEHLYINVQHALFAMEWYWMLNATIILRNILHITNIITTKPIFYKCTKVDLASFPLFLYRKRAIHSWDSKNFWGLCSPVCQCPRLFLKDNINNSLYNVFKQNIFYFEMGDGKKLFCCCCNLKWVSKGV